MAIRITTDREQPSAAIEISLEEPLPDYDLEQVEQATPREIDAVLVSQGFRDLVDDARGVLMELLADPPALKNGSHLTDLGISCMAHFELTQLTGAICPGGEGVYRPGLWLVLRDPKAPQNQNLSEGEMNHLRAIVEQFVKRLGLS